MVELAASWRLVAGVLAAGVLAVAAVPTVDEPAGRALLLAVAALLVGAAVREVVLRPVLVADGDGLTVRSGWGRRHVPWQSGVRVRATSSRARLVRTSWLEVDDGTTLVLLHAWRLGAPVAVAAERVRGVDPRVNHE